MVGVPAGFGVVAGGATFVAGLAGAFADGFVDLVERGGLLEVGGLAGASAGGVVGSLEGGAVGTGAGGTSVAAGGVLALLAGRACSTFDGGALERPPRVTSTAAIPAPASARATPPTSHGRPEARGAMGAGS